MVLVDALIAAKIYDLYMYKTCDDLVASFARALMTLSARRRLLRVRHSFLNEYFTFYVFSLTFIASCRIFSRNSSIICLNWSPKHLKFRLQFKLEFNFKFNLKRSNLSSFSSSKSGFHLKDVRLWYQGQKCD